MGHNKKKKTILLVVGTGLLATLLGNNLFEASEPQETAAPATGGERRPVAKDYFQRSLRIYEFKQRAESGLERGREIFYYKCWYCHNEYQKVLPLEGLSKRPQLTIGGPVNVETLTKRIREGGAGMPAFRYTLREQDIADVVSLLLSNECCFSSEEQPLNPKYRAR